MSTHKSPSYFYILAMNTWKFKKKNVKLTKVATNENLGTAITKCTGSVR